MNLGGIKNMVKMAKLYDIDKQITLLYHCKQEFERLYGRNCKKIDLYNEICDYLDNIDLKGEQNEQR